MVIANFEQGETSKKVRGIRQWDYGQVLRIQGLSLPTAVEIHFSLQESRGDCITRIGVTRDGVTDVVIPDSMVENDGATGKEYYIYAWVYLTDETSGHTGYEIKLSVETRSKPEAFDKPEDAELFREAIKAVNECADRAEEAAKKEVTDGRIDTAVTEYLDEHGIKTDKTLTEEDGIANAKAVGDELDKKADKEAVRNELEKKANTKDVENELAKYRFLDPTEDNEGKFLKIENGEAIWSAVGITPPSCSSLFGLYNRNLKRNKLRFKEPDDIVVDGITICAVSCVKIVKNNSHVPANPYDGTVVDTIYRENFNKHIYSFYVDETTIPEEGEVWYYKLFPYSSEGNYNADDSNAITIEIKPYTVYGFTIDPNESDPFSNITYIEENTNFTPAHMDYTTGKFDYGDWASAWFITDLKPCRLNSDGSVAYDLNPNDYSLKADGTASDIADSNVDGNIMVGIPKVYYKMTQNDDGTISYRFSDSKIDEEYKCYAHMDANGNEIPYAYQPAYNGSRTNNKLRSLSRKSIMHSNNTTNEIAYATANNLEDSNIWYTEVLADRMLINLLLMLIGKSTDTQTTFGNGHYTGGSNPSHLLASGTMDDKGLFWGTNGTGSGVKVFGIENYWGNQWRRIGGYICDNGVQKIKLTYGTQDGSLSTGYTATGNGYIVIEDSTPTGSSGGYLNEMIFTKYGLVPKKSSGSATTYFCDGMWYNNSICSYALVGGLCNNGLQVGAFAVALDCAAFNGIWNVGAALSCKPLATV